MASLDHLKHLDRERKAAIVRMAFQVVGDCPACGEGIRACDPRRVVDGDLYHLACVSDAGAGGSAPAGGTEGEEVAE